MAVVEYDAVFNDLFVICGLAKKEVNFD